VLIIKNNDIYGSGCFRLCCAYGHVARVRRDRGVLPTHWWQTANDTGKT